MCINPDLTSQASGRPSAAAEFNCQAGKLLEVPHLVGFRFTPFREQLMVIPVP